MGKKRKHGQACTEMDYLRDLARYCARQITSSATPSTWGVMR